MPALSDLGTVPLSVPSTAQTVTIIPNPSFSGTASSFAPTATEMSTVQDDQEQPSFPRDVHSFALSAADDNVELEEPLTIEYRGNTYTFAYSFKKDTSTSWSKNTDVGKAGSGRDIRAAKEKCNERRIEGLETGHDRPYSAFVLPPGSYNGVQREFPCAWVMRKATPEELERHEALASAGSAHGPPLFATWLVNGVQQVQRLIGGSE